MCRDWKENGSGRRAEVINAAQLVVSTQFSPTTRNRAPPQSLATRSKIHSCYTLSNVRQTPCLARSSLNKTCYANAPIKVTASVTNAISHSPPSRIGGSADRQLHLAILPSIDYFASARPGRSPVRWAMVVLDVGTVAPLLASTNICFAGATPSSYGSSSRSEAKGDVQLFVAFGYLARPRLCLS